MQVPHWLHPAYAEYIGVAKKRKAPTDTVILTSDVWLSGEKHKVGERLQRPPHVVAELVRVGKGNRPGDTQPSTPSVPANDPEVSRGDSGEAVTDGRDINDSGTGTTSTASTSVPATRYSTNRRQRGKKRKKTKVNQ